MLTWIILIVAVLACGIVAYYYFSKKESSKIPETGEPETVPFERQEQGGANEDSGVMESNGEVGFGAESSDAIDRPQEQFASQESEEPGRELNQPVEQQQETVRQTETEQDSSQNQNQSTDSKSQTQPQEQPKQYPES